MVAGRGFRPRSVKYLLEYTFEIKTMKTYKTISVAGLGYIGLPTACYLAAAGYDVIGVDTKVDKVKMLSEDKLPFQEPGLPELFAKAKKNMRFATEQVVADVYIISVPTPIQKNKKQDLSFVKQAAGKINPVLRDEDLVVIESTVPSGAAEKIILPILKKNHRGMKIYLAHAPERAIPGSTLKEMAQNHRIIGGVDKESAELTKKIYSSFVTGKIYLTDATTAEFVKLIENSYRDTNIAFANDLAKICDEIKIDVWEAIGLANLHPRVNIHQPGPGVGGHCIAIDPWFLIRPGSAGNQVIETSRKINDSMPLYAFKCVKGMLAGIKKPTITILGVSYKANVGDWRETPALKIIAAAKKAGWRVTIHDPLAAGFPFEVEKDIVRAAQDSDCLVLAAGHDFYRDFDPARIIGMRHKKIMDARNVIDPVVWKKAGFEIKILGNGKTI